MAKNRQKSAKIIRKIDFPYNNLQKKDISLRKCTKKKKKRLRRKNIFFSRFWRDTAGTGGAIPICPSGDSAQRSSFLGQMPFFGKQSLFFFWPKNGPKMAQKWSKMAKIAPQIGEINRGGPPENSNESQKHRKNGQKRSHYGQYENAPKQ